MNMRYAKEEEIDDIKEIWNYCFNDEESFVNYYFNNKYDNNNTIVACEDKDIVSSLQLNQYKIKLDGKEYETSYVVGVSTFPQVRGRGYMKKIMEYSLNELYKRNQLVSILMPIDYRLYRKYGYEHCDVVILEGIMYDEWYSPLFKTANELYGMDIYAYYFDIPFEETVRRHNTRDKKQEFGEEDMRRWWREKDFSSVFNEKIITSDIDADSIVEMIYMDSANEG